MLFCSWFNLPLGVSSTPRGSLNETFLFIYLFIGQRHLRAWETSSRPTNITSLSGDPTQRYLQCIDMVQMKEDKISPLT